MWLNVYEPELPPNMFKTKLYISRPLNTEISDKIFIDWCDKFIKNNPTIYIPLNLSIDQIIYILSSLYATLSKINLPNCRKKSQKMIVRHHQTGFPIIIKIKCITNDCTGYCICTRKYPDFLKKYNLPDNYPKQLYCNECKINNSAKNISKMFDDLHIDSSNMIID